MFPKTPTKSEFYYHQNQDKIIDGDFFNRNYEYLDNKIYYQVLELLEIRVLLSELVPGDFIDLSVQTFLKIDSISKKAKIFYYENIMFPGHTHPNNL